MHSPTPLFQVRDPMSALTHFIAFLAAIFATPVLIVHAAETGADRDHLVSLSIFMLSMVLLYGASTAYHTFSLTEKGCRTLKKLDHTMIFYLIAGSYTPVCVVALQNYRLLALVWALAVAGTVFKLCWVCCPKWVSSVIYIAMGWSCLTAMPQIIAALDKWGFFWLLLGGIFYTVGGVLYALKPKCLEGKRFGIHEFFHVFVMAGSVCHYVFMYNIM
ncbi:MAG: hemolysin III family protein [Oscillospiraceae bacterium]|nr:hemolysin III family protein [Oscillospiraceae bacterium]